MLRDPPSHLSPLVPLVRRLLSGETATATLEAWCRQRRLPGGPLVARRLTGAAVAVSPPEHLEAAPDEAVLHRRVALAWGGIDLVHADNFCMPGRLPPELARELSTGDRPFGAVVAALMPVRQTLALIPEPRPGVLLLVHALLRDGQGRPLAEVREQFLAAMTAAAGSVPEVR